MFYEVLQAGLGVRAELSRALSLEEWSKVYQEAQRQAVLGVLACGLERLPKEQQPPKEVLLQWVAPTIRVEHQNAIVFKACKDVVAQFEKDGFRTCVLKGKANHRYYPANMQNRRSSGDIDIWVEPDSEASDKSAGVVLDYVRSHHEITGLCWLHCNYTEGKGVPIEVHFHPSFMNEPCKNRRFLRHFSSIERCAESVDIDGVELPVLKVEEDVIYQMNHIYRHLLDEGVGLRQVVDYYFLLRAWNNNATRSREETMCIVSKFGMKRFAGALMYVMREVCGMENEMLLCEPNERDGRFLLSEIMAAGNFGHADPRMSSVSGPGLRRQISRAWRRINRNMRFVTSYPGEVMWEPIARFYHFIWKKRIL